MANAIKDTAKYIKKNPESEAAVILWELCKALESESPFELRRLFDLDLKTFDLAIGILNDWRIDRLIAERRIQKYLDLENA